METRQKCKRERYYSNHYGPERKGLQLRGSKYAADFGNLFHEGAAMLLTTGQVGNFKDEVNRIVRESFPQMDEADTIFTVNEQSDLLHLLLVGWKKYRLPAITKQYEVVSVEQEWRYTFMPGDYLPANYAAILRPLVLPLRIDALLKHKDTGVHFILDFKTAGRVSDDWNTALDNSLQSCLYLEAAERYIGEYLGGIFYAGAVKGKRELDKAKSSPYQGKVIQYGSFLYGWRDKAGKVHKEYVTGRTRHYIPRSDVSFEVSLRAIEDAGFNIQSYFPITVPWKPMNTRSVVAQQIVAENNYQGELEMLWEHDPITPEFKAAEGMLMEQSLTNCFKYGTKNPCQFVSICHHSMEEEEIDSMYETRIDHHEQPEE